MNISNKYPIRLDSPRAWRTYTGGANLNALHGNDNGEISQFPEEWIMSVVEARNAGREDIIGEGLSHLLDEDNLSLKELVSSNPSLYLGEKHASHWGNQMGVLVKLIDSAERLTVQVHPNKELARTLFDSDFGKTESWHILKTFEVDGEKACVYMGFKEGITKEEWKHLFDIQDIQGMLDCMHKIEVHPGDTILIKGGVPHAIGAGCFLCEIQEPTDYTVRIEKVTPAGLTIAESMLHQGLGFEKMFDCFIYEGISEDEAKSRWFIPAKTISQSEKTIHRTIIGYDTCPLFTLEEIVTSDSITLACPPVFSGLYILEGEGALISGDKSIEIAKAQQYFLPAGTEEFTLKAKTPLRVMRFFGPRD